GDGWVRRRRHSIAQRHDVVVANARVGELRDAGGTVDDGDCRTVEHAELSLEAGLRLPLSRQLEDKRMHEQVDALDLVSAQSVLAPELNTAVDRGMYDDSASKGLVGVLQQLPAFAESIRDLAVVARGGENVRKSSLAFEPLLGAGEIALREQRR